MTRQDFRVYDLPKPDAKVQGIAGSSGALTVGRLSSCKSLRPKPKTLFLKWTIKYNPLKWLSRGRVEYGVPCPSNSDRFTSAAKRSVSVSSDQGQRIMIEKIKASGPDGVIRNLNSITITVR